MPSLIRGQLNTKIMIKKRRITETISEKIWQYVWNNASNEDMDEDLCNEHTEFCRLYRINEFNF